MNDESPSVISIGYGRNFFIEGNHELLRMQQCAESTSELHMVIFTRSFDRFRKLKVTEKLTLHPTSSSSKLTMVLDAFLAASSIIKNNPEKQFIVTTQDPFEAGLVGWLLKKFHNVSLVIQEHGDVFGTEYWREESFMNKVRYSVGLRLLQTADVVRVVSMRTEQYFRALGITRITRLPVAIDTTRFKSAVASPTVSELFGSDTFVFLTVARFVSQKNLLMLIRAFHDTYTVHPRARLLLIGTGPQEKILKTEVANLFGDETDIVKFLPWTDDVAGFMKASDTYVLSSNYEGWGRVIIEAMVTGLPSVTTDVGCAGEVVRDSEHGLVVPVGDESAFTQAMSRLIADESLREHIKDTLANIPHSEIPGTTIDTYGADWVKTLQIL